MIASTASEGHRALGDVGSVGQVAGKIITENVSVCISGRGFLACMIQAALLPVRSVTPGA
jgi:hypothetical protein